MGAFDSEALRVWRGTPILQRAFVDFQSFAEHYACTRGEGGNSFRGHIRRWVAYLDSEIAGARERMELARLPLTAPARNLRFIERIAPNRMALWCYGAIGPALGARAPIIRTDELAEALDAEPAPELITLRIDSSGGSVDVAVSIARMLSRWHAHKIAIIDGVCGSAANWFVAVADHTQMRKSALWYSHRCIRTYFNGNEEALRHAYIEIRNQDLSLARAMSSKRRISFRNFQRVQTEERFLTAEEAHTLGLIDEVIPDINPGGDEPAGSP
jgi:ATP-dependent protease ClpP protease subunit